MQEVQPVSKHPTRGKILKGIGIVFVVLQSGLGTLYILPATWLTVRLSGYEKAAAAIAITGFAGKSILVGYYLLSPFNSIAETMNDKFLDREWWQSLREMTPEERVAARKKVRSIALWHLTGIVSAVFFPVFIEVTCNTFQQTVYKNQHKLAPFFLELARWAGFTWLRRLMEVFSGLSNLMGIPTILAAFIKMLQELREEINSCSTRRQKIKLGVELSAGLMATVVALWGMANYPELSIQLADQFFGLSFLPALPFAIWQTATMGSLGVLSAMTLGRGAAKLLTCAVECSSKSTVVRNVTVGTVTGVFVLIAGLGIVFQAIAAGEGKLTQVMTEASSAMIDAAPSYLFIQAAVSGSQYIWQKCSSAFFSPKPKLNPTLSSIQVPDEESLLLPPPSPIPSKRFCCTVQ